MNRGLECHAISARPQGKVILLPAGAYSAGMDTGFWCCIILAAQAHHYVRDVDTQSLRILAVKRYSRYGTIKTRPGEGDSGKLTSLVAISASLALPAGLRGLAASIPGGAPIELLQILIIQRTC